MADDRHLDSAFPIGLTTKVVNNIAHVWVFTKDAFPKKEVSIDVSEKKAPLLPGKWAFLKQEDNGTIRYREFPKDLVPPAEVAISNKGDVELTTTVVFSTRAVSENLPLNTLCAWSPLLGAVGAFFDHSEYSETKVFQATLKRVKASISQKYGYMEWAVMRSRPIEPVGFFEQDALDVPLQERKAVHEAVVVEEDGEYLTVWSRMSKLARMPKELFPNVRVADFIKYSSKLNCNVGIIPIIENCEKIEKPYPSRCVNGLAQIQASSGEAGALPGSLYSSLLGNVDSSAVWMAWDRRSWKIVSENATSSPSLPSSNLASTGGGEVLCPTVLRLPSQIAAPSSAADTSNATLSSQVEVAGASLIESQGIVVEDNDVLVVAPLKGYQLVYLYEHFTYENGEKVNIGEWVSVRSVLDQHTGVLVPAEAPRSLQPRGECRIVNNGQVQVRTIIANIRKENYDAYGESEELGKVKDIYETVAPRSDPGSRYLVWCHHVALPHEECFWALVKGENPFSGKSSPQMGTEDLQATATSSSSNSSSTASNKCRLSPTQFVASVRRIMEKKNVVDVLKLQDPEALEKILLLLSSL